MKKIIFFLTIPIFFCSMIHAQEKVPALPKSNSNLVVIAHRGSHLNKPENTIASTMEAIALGADYVEMDLRTTKDGFLILLHHDRVDQVSNGQGSIRDLNLNEAKQLILKGKDGTKHHLARFEDALKVCKGKINIYLDFKEADVAQTYQAIQAAGMEKQVLVYLNSLEQYQDWHRIAPDMPLMSSLPESVKSTADLTKFLNNIRLSAIDHLPSEILLPKLKNSGISIFADVQSKNESTTRWMNMINTGIQGLQTDHPEELIRFLKEKGWR